MSAALRICPVQQAQLPGPVRSGPLPACAGAIPHSPRHLRLRAARKQRTRSSAMGAARCRHRYPALSTVLAGRCPRCWSRRRPGRGGPGREAVPGAEPGPPRAPAPSPSTPPGPPSPPPRRGPETQRRRLKSPSPPLHRGPLHSASGAAAPRAGIRAGGRSGGRARGWNPGPEPPRLRRTPVEGSQRRGCGALGSLVSAGLQPCPVPPPP